MTKIDYIHFEDAKFLDRKTRAEQVIQDEAIPTTFQSIVNVLCTGLTVLSIIIVLACYNYGLIAIALISIIPMFVTRIIRGKQFFYLKQIQARRSRYLTYLWNLFFDKKTAKEMRVMGFDHYIADKWNNVRNEVDEETFSLLKKDHGTLFFCELFRIVCYCVSIVIILYLVLKNISTIGVFGACLHTFGSLQENAKMLIVYIGNCVENSLNCKVYFDFLNLEETNPSEGGKATFNEAITLKNVSFTYPNAERKAINNVNLIIKKNETVVILGENGSGKTSLTKLILGAYNPDEGSVCYDGKDVRNLSKNSLSEFTSAMPQNFGKYSLNIRENIALSNSQELNNDKKISDVLENVELTEVVNEKGGYDVAVGREFGGVEFSGGEWQKIAIARSLYRDYSLIMMDEPTSALDPVKESEILTSFLQLSKEKTSIIVSHRVGLCRFVDKIVVMDKGQIKEVGTHKELMQKDGWYKKLYNEQKKWYFNDEM